jgi:hypothetical protein
VATPAPVACSPNGYLAAVGYRAAQVYDENRRPA